MLLLPVYQLTQKCFQHQTPLQYIKSVPEKLLTVLPPHLMDSSIKLMEPEPSKMDLLSVESMMFGDTLLKNLIENLPRNLTRTSTTTSQSNNKSLTATKVHSTLVITPNKLEEEIGIKMVKIAPTFQLTLKMPQPTIVLQLLILFTKRVNIT
jgi:hypothetical protein